MLLPSLRFRQLKHSFYFIKIIVDFTGELSAMNASVWIFLFALLCVPGVQNLVEELMFRRSSLEDINVSSQEKDP